MNQIRKQLLHHNIFAEIVCVFSAIGLLVIWVLPNTIALRHVLMSIGFVSAIWITYKNQLFLHSKFSSKLPLIFLGLIFIWLLTHYLFFSLNRDMEWKEIKGVWFRSFLVFFIAIGVRLSIDKTSWLKTSFFLAIFAVPMINIGAYIYLSLLGGKLLLPAEFVWKFNFKKIEAGFYGVLAIAVACANIFWATLQKHFKWRSIIYWGIGVAIALISAMLANTKNGVAGGVGLCLLLILFLIIRTLWSAFQHKDFGKIKKIFWTAFSILTLILAIGFFHQKFASPGWDTLIEDIRYSSKVSDHNYWREPGLGGARPKNASGTVVAGNTYERVAWAVVGIQLVKAYPLGYGSINRSFVGMLNHAQIEQKLDGQTHSGWIDFALAFGVPGIFILAMAFLLVIYFGMKQLSQFSLIGIWLVLGIVPFGLIAEITYKHNFETLIFFIALACSLVIREKN